MVVAFKSPTFDQTENLLSSHFVSIDDLIRQRASEKSKRPVLGYPRSELGLTDYEYFSASDVNQLADGAARSLLEKGLLVQGLKPLVAAIIGYANLEMLMTVCGLSRLGYTVLVFSPRLSVDAYRALLRTTDCSIVLYVSELTSTVREIQESRPLTTLSILKRTEFDRVHFAADQRIQCLDDPARLHDMAFIMHSSGSTGLPKPIFFTHQRCLEAFTGGFGDSVLMTLPLYHAYGFSSFYRSLYARNTLILLNCRLPITAANLTSVLKTVRPDTLSVVPYTLQVMAKSDEGIEALQTCSLVTFHGSACPDEVGDRLVAQNVNLVGHMGSTETGALMTSFRPKGDDAWNYYRFLPSVKPFIYMKPIDADNFECVILEGLNSVALTNSDDPPNSYHTKDIFIPHPRIEGAWKYVSRLDDRITLVNGEKVLPLPIEGLIRENPLVKEAIVFGVGRSVPGLLVFRNRDADAMADEEFTSSLWPTIQRANSKAESFSQISKEMIIAFASEVEYPRTDKGSIMRAKAYEKFANEIRDSYIERSSEGKLKLAPQECRGFLQQTIQEQFGLDIGVDDDLYTAGVDSLRATQLSRLITSRLYLGDNANKIGPNFVYECGTILKLAEYLTDLGKNFTDFKSSSFGSVEELIQKYSQFPKHVPAWRSSDQNHVVVLTGATGSMGTYVLARLAEKETVNKVICLVRAEDREAALARVLASVKTRRLILPEKALDKITAFGSDLSKEDLGLGRPILDQLKNEVSVIIHCAWAVNFNLGIHSFEDQHLRGTFNLIGLSLCARAPRPARMIFCSSVSVAAKTSPHTTVPEALIENFSVVSETGYAQSKYVAEHMLANAVETGGARGQVLRIGQVVGDTIHGVWNDSEAIPLMIRSALTLKALPALQEEMSWLPVDQLADIILDLASISAPPFSEQTADGSMVYNVVNPARFSWTQDLLPALRNAGMEFETTAPKEWISRLQASDPDVGANPTYKLLAFFTERYNYGSEDEGRGNPIFDTKRAQAASNTMGNLPHSLEDKLIKKFVDSWMSKWTRPRAI